MKYPAQIIIPATLCFLFLNAGLLSQPEQVSKIFKKKTVITQQSGEKENSARRFYQQAYRLILDQRLSEAREELKRIVREFPISKYSEAATYWIAFTLKEADHEKAIEVYRSFIDEYPNSNYYDDAIADLDELLDEPPKQINISVPIIRIDGRGNFTTDSLHVAHKHKNKRFTFYANIVPRVPSLEKLLHLKVMNKQPPSPVNLGDILPPEMRKKLNVVATKKGLWLDGETFHILQKAALDQSNPEEVREAAVVSLSITDTFDAMPVFADIMINDTNKGLQFYAIENLSQYSKDRDKAVRMMINLFNELPEDKEEEREMIFYSIADVGNDQAVDFFIDIIESKERKEFVDEAIYYLGSIGTEKARKILRKVYKNR